VEAGEISCISDICVVVISFHVLGAKGVARHVCEIVGSDLDRKEKKWYL
jgi:hypothetical protein